MANFQHRKHLDSFQTAWRGIGTAFSTQPNFKIMFLASFCVVVGGVFFQISLFEWIALVLTVGLMFMAEMVNTSIEAVVDLVTREWKSEAKVAKDVGGGMVLLMAVFAFLIGVLIFVPKIIILFNINS